MAILMLQRQAVLVTVVLAVAVVAYDEDPIPAKGSSLAQGAMKYQGATLLSEVPGAVDDFASLEDDFDEKAQYAEVEPRPSVFTNPTTYFAIALVLGASVLLTPTPEQPQTKTKQNLVPPVPKINLAKQEPEIQPTQDLSPLASSIDIPKQDACTAPTRPSVPKLNLAQQYVDLVNAAVDPAQPEIKPKQNPSSLVPKLELCKPVASIGAKTEAPEVVDRIQAQILEAADACKAGKANSYANFCRLLAEKNAEHEQGRQS